MISSLCTLYCGFATLAMRPVLGVGERFAVSWACAAVNHAPNASGGKRLLARAFSCGPALPLLVQAEAGQWRLVVGRHAVGAVSAVRAP